MNMNCQQEHLMEFCQRPEVTKHYERMAEYYD